MGHEPAHIAHTRHTHQDMAQHRRGRQRHGRSRTRRQERSPQPRTSRVHYELLSPAGKTSATGYKDIKLNMRGEDTLRFLARIPDSLLWSPEKTTRFTLRVKTQHEGRYMEYIEVPLGFRTVEVQNGQLAVNGTPVTLRTREVPAHASADEIAALRGQGYNTLKLLPGPVSPDAVWHLRHAGNVRDRTGADRHPQQR